MSDQLSEVLNRADVGVCVVGKDGKVTFQNNSCKQSCADVCGSECTEKNVLLCRYASSFQEGTVRIPMQSINGRYFDILGIVLPDCKMIYLIPVQNEKIARAREIEESALTCKEKEVAALMIAGFSRENIAAVLNVSENTIKTHIKNIYSKIPAEAGEMIRGKAVTSKSSGL